MNIEEAMKQGTQGPLRCTTDIIVGPQNHIVAECGQDLIGAVEARTNAALLAHWYNHGPKLREEHRQWAEELGTCAVRALQEDFSPLLEWAKNHKIDFTGGSPVIDSEALAAASEVEDI